MPLAPLLPWAQESRDWQTECFEAYLTSGEADYLIVGTPGCGKTYMGCRLLHYHLRAQSAVHVLIICPSVPMVQQWIDDAHVFGGIQLGTLDNRDALRYGVVQDYHGHAATYAQLATDLGKAAFTALVHRFQGEVVVIFDEIHHAGTDLTWGETIQQLFSGVRWRIAMSGTPFRTDGTSLPFVRYDADRRCIADYNYSYGRALRDRVCRSVVFPKFEGQLEWWNGEETLQATFKDDLSENEARQRLKAALTSDWLEGVIQDAHRYLLRCRSQGHVDAGGLIVCIDDVHAQRVATQVRLLTGTSPH